MSNKPRIVVVGTSTGGLSALKQLLCRVPADFPAAILIVMHIGSHDSVLPDILSKHIALPVRHAIDGEPVRPGAVLIAPPDRHMLVEAGRVRVARGPQENFARPAVDPLFRSAAFAYREKAIGVVLTGNLDDGTIGLQAIKANGGIAIAQDPEEAEMPSMPRSAVEHCRLDFCLPLEGIADVLVKLARQPVAPHARAADAERISIENRFALMEQPAMEELAKIGKLSSFTCPECHGSLWEIEGSAPPRFRCHTGHAFTARALESGQDHLVEEAIWAAVRALHEKQSLLKRFAALASQSDRRDAAADHEASAHQAAMHAEVLRKMVGD
jgi:two-component system chemotaxis response regulator CheB